MTDPLPAVLDAAALGAVLAAHPDWRLTATGRLRREFRFPDFAAAFAFVSRVAQVAERQGHHPDLGCGWGRAFVETVTHDAAGLTARDVALVRAVDGLGPTG